MMYLHILVTECCVQWFTLEYISRAQVTCIYMSLEANVQRIKTM